MGIYGAVLTIFYDKRTKKVTTWNSQLRREDVVIADNLLKGSVTKAEGTNNESEVGKIEYSLNLSRISKPSIISVPFEDLSVRHRPLYIQKDFFHAEGTLTVNGEVMHATEETTAIIDDHRGCYPEVSHYDWVTTMGIHNADDEKNGWHLI